MKTLFSLASLSLQAAFSLLHCLTLEYAYKQGRSCLKGGQKEPIDYKATC